MLRCSRVAAALIAACALLSLARPADAQGLVLANTPGEAHPAALGWAEIWELADRDIDAAAERIELVDMAAEPRLTRLPESKRLALIWSIQRGWVTQWIEGRRHSAALAEAFDLAASVPTPATSRLLAHYIPVLAVREQGRDFYDLLDPATGRVNARMGTDGTGVYRFVISMDELRKSASILDEIPIEDVGTYLARQGEAMTASRKRIEAGDFANVAEADEALLDQEFSLQAEMTGQPVFPTDLDLADEDDLAPAP